MADNNLPGRNGEQITSGPAGDLPQELRDILIQLQANIKTIVTLVPSDAEIINVDLNTRKIEIEQSVYAKVLSVAREHYAETVYFRVPRYFDNVDLLRMTCVIEYTNAAGLSRVSPIMVRDIVTEPGYMLIGWCIHGDATMRAGSLRFAMRFYSIDTTTKELVYSLRTQMASGRILYGVDDSHIDAEEENPLLNKPLYELIDAVNAKSAVYWNNL